MEVTWPDFVDGLIRLSQEWKDVAGPLPNVHINLNLTGEVREVMGTFPALAKPPGRYPDELDISSGPIIDDDSTRWLDGMTGQEFKENLDGNGTASGDESGLDDGADVR